MQQVWQDNLNNITWESISDAQIAIGTLMQFLAEKVCGCNTLEKQQQYLKDTMIPFWQFVEELVKQLFIINK